MSGKQNHLSSLFSHAGIRIGVFLLGLIMMLSIVSLFWTPHPSTVMNPAERLLPPGLTHLFGTDQYGRDIFSRIMVGGQISLLVGFLTVSIGLFIGVPLGLIAIFFSGTIDDLIMKMTDTLFSFPAILTAILLTTLFKPSVICAISAIAIFYIPVFARITRGAGLNLWHQKFILSARALGVKETRIVITHLLPNIVSPLLIQSTIQFALAILSEAGLSYLGLGVQPPTPSWGRMLNEAQTLIGIAPWMVIFPGLAIAFTVLGLNFLGDGLRDLLDPKLKYRP